MVETKYPAHWLVGYMEKILERDPEEINLATGKTPSGHIHIGILREVIMCDALRRIFEQKNFTVNNRLFFDDLDAAKRFPKFIDDKSSVLSKEHLGKPFAHIPDPYESGADSYGGLFAQELLDALPAFGVSLDPVYAHDLYGQDRMFKAIKIAMDNADKVKKIITRYNNLPEGWNPAMVICENCGRTQDKKGTKICNKCDAPQRSNDQTECVECNHTKLRSGSVIVPNRVLTYESETGLCGYLCPACGHEGKTAYDSGNIKLNWRMDWPSKWWMFKTICEPAGKDHCTKNGSYDTGLSLSQEIYEYEGPVPLPYEWVRLGDYDMSTSQGIVFTPKEYMSMGDPILLRWIILTTTPKKHISFRIEEMENYLAELQRLEEIYFRKQEAEEEVRRMVDFIYPLIQISEDPLPEQKPENCPDHLPFKFLQSMVQLEPLLGIEDIHKKVKEYCHKNELNISYTQTELQEALGKVRNWIAQINRIIENEKDAKKQRRLQAKIIEFSIPKTLSAELVGKLNETDKQVIGAFLQKIQDLQKEDWTAKTIKSIMQSIPEELGIGKGKIFKPLYLILIGQQRGPRIAPLLELLDLEWVIERYSQAI